MMSDNIHVAIRVRPLIEREIKDGNPVSWTVIGSNQIYQVERKGKPVQGSAFVFDSVFPTSSTNGQVYQKMCHSIVKSVVFGFHGTIFAYGQTSSGKTYTMMGTQDDPGVIMNAVEDIFKNASQIQEREFFFRVSYMEIYNEKILDLISSHSNLQIKENIDGQVFVADLEEVIVKSVEDVLQVMANGERNRHFGGTAMNEHSSRSHTIFKMVVQSRLRVAGEDSPVNISHLNLVDLAGSEKAGQMGTTGNRFKEGVHINKSLLTLSQVISNLSEGGFVNYRDSKLTRILQNSLGGNSLTAIICTVTPTSIEQTQSTLNFAVRAKRIQNKPVVNEVLTEAAQIRKHQQQIATLQEQVRQKETVIAKLQKTGPLSSLQNYKLGPSTSSLQQRSTRRETWSGNLMPSSTAQREITKSDGGVSTLCPVPEGISEDQLAEISSQEDLLMSCPNITRRRKNNAKFYDSELTWSDVFEEKKSFLEFPSPSQVQSPLKIQLQKEIAELKGKNLEMKKTIKSLQEEYKELQENTIIEREVIKEGTVFGEPVSFTFLIPSPDVSILKYSFGCQTEDTNDEVVCDSSSVTADSASETHTTVDVETQTECLYKFISSDVITQTEYFSKTETTGSRSLCTSQTQTQQSVFCLQDTQSQTEDLPYIQSLKQDFTECKLFPAKQSVLSESQSTRTEWTLQKITLRLEEPGDQRGCIVHENSGNKPIVLISEASCQTEVSVASTDAVIQTENVCWANSVAQTEVTPCVTVSCQTSFFGVDVTTQSEDKLHASAIVQTHDVHHFSVSSEALENTFSSVNLITRKENTAFSSIAVYTDSIVTQSVACQTSQNFKENSTQTNLFSLREVHSQTDSFVLDFCSTSVQTEQIERSEFQACVREKGCQTEDIQHTIEKKPENDLTMEDLEDEIKHWRENCDFLTQWGGDRDREATDLKEKLMEKEAELGKKIQECSIMKSDFINLQIGCKAKDAQIKDLQEKVNHYQSKAQQATARLRRAENSKMDNTVLLRNRDQSVANPPCEPKTNEDPYRGVGVAARIRISSLEKEVARLEKRNKVLESSRSSRSSSSLDKSTALKENISSCDLKDRKQDSMEVIKEERLSASASSVLLTNNSVSATSVEKLQQHQNKTPVNTANIPKMASCAFSPPAKTHVPIEHDFSLDMSKLLKDKGPTKPSIDSPDGCKQQ